MKKLKFLVSLHTKDNDFQIAQAAAAEEAAHKFGVDTEITFADNNAVNQSTQILKAIQNRPDARPDAIVLEPVSGTAPVSYTHLDVYKRQVPPKRTGCL